MNTRPLIHKVVYRWGMVADPTNWQGLKTVVLERAELSDEVVNAVFDNDLLVAGGVYGVPGAGEPVEISSLQITHEHGVTEVTVYNLGIMLFRIDDEVYRRVLRLCRVIGRQMAQVIQAAGFSKVKDVAGNLSGKAMSSQIITRRMCVAYLTIQLVISMNMYRPSRTACHQGATHEQ